MAFASGSRKPLTQTELHRLHETQTSRELRSVICRIANVVEPAQEQQPDEMSEYFTSSDDELEELLQILEVPKTTNFFEEIVPQLTDHHYFEHFCVSREVSQRLSEQFEASEYFHHQEGDSQKVSLEKIISIFLWYAGNEAASFRDVSDRFHISKSTLHKIIRRVTYFLSNMFPHIIVWPNVEEKITIERAFRQRGFPDVVGVIDGTHIKTDKPTEDPDSYLNR
ncbi:hypothetical protein MML48_6g00017277 [Holotrichia oblita]|uniref:Uncharacterized protein n=1 Tax=Holotrichia oblita TaxID=644536 RepID=A0ACB9SXT2_HOLOL|nr:hypothetical protein MML48_6g00017277 [Holotrichia oblita]